MQKIIDRNDQTYDLSSGEMESEFESIVDNDTKTSFQQISTSQRECCRAFYELGEQLSGQESMFIDYKHYVWPIVQSIITRKIAVEILSFLNCSGGALLIGVGDQDYKVKGIALTPKNREEFASYLDNKILCFIHPILKNEVVLSFIPIKSNGIWQKNLYIAKLLIQQGKTNELYTFASEPNEMVSSLRRQSSCYPLRSDQIKNEIQNRVNTPIRLQPTHYCIEPDREGIKESCRLSDLEIFHQQSMKSEDKDENYQSSGKKELFLQFIQSGSAMEILSSAVSQAFDKEGINYERTENFKQIQFKWKRSKHSQAVLSIISKLEKLFQQENKSLLRVICQKKTIFSMNISPQQVIIFSNIDRTKLKQFEKYLESEMPDISILPLEYALMVKVENIKDAWALLHRKRKFIDKYSFKGADVRYGISDNLKMTISNLEIEKIPEFANYFEQLTVGIKCKGEDNADTIVLFFPGLIDLILASERLFYLLYHDSKFRSFGKSQKIYFNIEIFQK